jgi:hypothetical protein
LLLWSSPRAINSAGRVKWIAEQIKCGNGLVAIFLKDSSGLHIFKLLSDKSGSFLMDGVFCTDAKFHNPTLPSHFSSRSGFCKTGVVQYRIERFRIFTAKSSVA